MGLGKSGAGVEAFLRRPGHRLPADRPPLRRVLMPAVLFLAMFAVALRALPPASDEALVPVRFPEGSLNGFLILRTTAGEELAHGNQLVSPRDGAMESRIVFRFFDGSVHDERVTFTQDSVFRLLEYTLVQRGPAFPADLEVELDRSGRFRAAHPRELNPPPLVPQAPALGARAVLAVIAGSLAALASARLGEPGCTSAETLAGLLLRARARVERCEQTLDVSFIGAAIDLRVRGAGLDRDPGWIPWLSRTVRFDFESEEI